MKKTDYTYIKSKCNTPYPSCIPDSTYGISFFWAEEYWAWKKIQTIREIYPNINLEGIINTEFEKLLLNMISKSPHNTLLGTENYKDLSSEPWEIDYNLINLATSHAPSRIKAEKFLRDYRENFLIINFDAHYDIGISGIIHGAWLTEELLKRTVIIGGWSESKHELNQISNEPIICENELEKVLNNSVFPKWIKNKYVYITFDLDYFQQENKMEGISCYWHRDFINGHSRNILQEIELLITQDKIIDNYPIGISLDLFQDLKNFKIRKQKSIQVQINNVKNLLKRITEVFQEESVVLLNLDIVEYSPLSDWKNLSIIELVKSFNSFLHIIS